MPRCAILENSGLVGIQDGKLKMSSHVRTMIDEECQLTLLLFARDTNMFSAGECML
jgi:hypothetical protein